MRSCIIIDDEPRARQLLGNMLAESNKDIVILAYCDDLPNGVKAIKQHKPELVFLDIEMPGYSGLQLLDFLTDDEVCFDLIFTTGYSEYAIQAFKLSAVDYLLKPINPDMLQEALQKTGKRNKEAQLQTSKALQWNLENTAANDKCITVNLSSSTRFIKINDILMLSAEGSYCKLYLNGGEVLLASRNLKYFEERLVTYHFFFRTHKSFLVNLKKVSEFSKGDSMLKLHANLEAAISSDKYEVFLERMEAL